MRLQSHKLHLLRGLSLLAGLILLSSCSSKSLFGRLVHKKQIRLEQSEPAAVDELSSGEGEGKKFLARTLYEQLVMVYERVQITIRDQRIDYEGNYLENVQEDLQIRVEDSEGEIYGDRLMRDLIEDASEDPDVAVTNKVDAGDISEILELHGRIVDRGMAVFYQGTQDDEFNTDLDTGLELLAGKGTKGTGGIEGKGDMNTTDEGTPTIDCEAALKTESFGAMVAAACSVPAAASCGKGGDNVESLSQNCIESVACEVGAIVGAVMAASASYEGDCR